jgi:hypothetical protein
MLLYVIIIIILIILYSIYLLYEKINNEDRTIENDGFIIISNPENKRNVLNYLPEGYNFIDYIYKIKGCSISTFHRDITSSQYIFKTKYPVYTYIVYYNKGNLLSIVPNSHRSVPFLWNSVYTITSHEDIGVLFNCDLIHAGAINTFGDKRLAMQYKICHEDDIAKLAHLEGINKTSKGNCNNNKTYEYILRKISLLFPYIINHLFTDLLQKKPKEDSMLNYLINNFYIGDFYIND